MIECYRCHGPAGRGDGASAPTLNDDAGFPITAADLTENWSFNGGGTVEDIYRRLRTGLDGTPMPSFSDLIDAEVISGDDLWNLAHYVRSLAPEREPRVREVITAEWVADEGVATTLDDERWGEVEPYYVPMVGQIVVGPRWFNPRVDGVWVQAMHDGQELAMRVSWSDPSRSPDPEWEDYANQVVAAMAGTDLGAATGAGPGDRFTVQFPQALSDGMERPFFLQGDSRRPAYLWTWSSDGDATTEAVARGMGSVALQEPAATQVSGASVHDEGQWRVLFRRALTTEDEEDLQLTVGEAIPVGFQAWDGDNGEQGTQGSVSTWYFLALEQPTAITVYIAPVFALALTFAFGLFIVSQARKERGPADAFASEVSTPGPTGASSV
jgi:hypothetical protein